MVAFASARTWRASSCVWHVLMTLYAAGLEQPVASIEEAAETQLAAWTGFGMDNAGTDAVFLAEAIDVWLSGRSSETEAFAEYHLRRDEHALPGFPMTADYGRDLSALAAG